MSASDLPASPIVDIGDRRLRDAWRESSSSKGDNRGPAGSQAATAQGKHGGRGRLGAIGFGRPEKRDELYDMPPLWSERPLARTLPSTRALPSLRGARPDVGSDAALRGEAAPVEDGSGRAGL